MTEDPAFAVRAVVFGQPTAQPCEDAEAAAVLFDRLRRFTPWKACELIQHGRVVEIYMPGAGRP